MKRLLKDVLVLGLPVFILVSVGTLVGFRYLGVFSSTKEAPTSALQVAPNVTTIDGDQAALHPRQPSLAPIERIIIPRIGIDAGIVTMGVDRDGTMQSPNRPEQVAWYNFSAPPGLGSNAVFSGHVDWYTGITGVFWGLRKLEEGDLIQIKMGDSTLYTYRVMSNEVITADLNAQQLGEIIGPARRDLVTLITCDGSFNGATQEYSKRRVVRGELVSTLVSTAPDKQIKSE